ncbi:hypothetical protein [Flavobacterium sp. KACC 22763]|uniref:hypothetical protein n=1 Tax=Flavobacterium sp. KACC 22763 TaxID=3025668 RepID=UPI0023662BFD|nr:hypothetical protein [Flavobacterium sp. KACC 22763]WDF64603.1 hypothetical protein PQ463_00330 [Flavobacterium sp. KACC 22763]
MKIRTLLLLSLLTISCKKETKTESEIPKIASKDSREVTEKKEPETQKKDTIVLSTKHKTNRMLCDLDGDNLDETVEIFRSTNNQKSGFRITYGNGKRTDYLGFGNDILGRGFDEIDWAGILEKAPKNEVYFDNVNEDGDIIGEEQVAEEDKIKLPNDGIFIHAEESCGGGVIYLKNGKYEWIQQE